MEISRLYQRLVEFGYVFKVENGKVGMKAALICNNDPRFDDWKRVCSLVTDLTSDRKAQTDEKKARRKELTQYVKLMSVYSEEGAIRSIQDNMERISDIGIWTGEELNWVKDSDHDLYELYRWYEEDIDLCCAEQDMIELRNTLDMYYKCMENVWHRWNWEHGQMLKAKYEMEAERDNPWKPKEDSLIMNDVKGNKKKKGKREIPDCFKFTGQTYITDLTASHRDETDSTEWKR